MSNLQPVIPDDREAVARLHRLLANEFAAGETLAGACDDRPLVQAFASHRIKAALAMQEAWQPIETAPQDGSEILAYSEHGCTGTMLVRHIALGDFLTDAEAEEYTRQGGSEDDYWKAEWFAADFIQGERLSPDCHPTHWMPVPVPPAIRNLEVPE